MIQRVSSASYSSNADKSQQVKVALPIKQNNNAVPIKPQIDGGKMAVALRAQAFIPMSRTISFGALFDDFENAVKQIKVCNSEDVGSRIEIGPIINSSCKELVKYDDAIKTTNEITKDKEKGTFTEARTQVKKQENGDVLLEMAVRPPRPIGTKLKKGEYPENIQDIQFTVDTHKEFAEKAYIMNTKGKLTSVIEDGNNVILTNAGTVAKKGSNKFEFDAQTKGREFKSFSPVFPIVTPIKPELSEGTGSEIIIGMEQGRFCPEIVDSIRKFERKIQNGELVLPKFVAKEGAENVQVAMLAGGFGSRAEYTNASSDGIFHGVEGGAQSTKGVFKTSTGFTPMETTFISLHMAGILDCSKEKFGIGKNVRFYLNKGANDGNGTFTMDLYKKTIQDHQKFEFIFPNDSISRMPNAISDVVSIMNEGNTAIAMIAKKVPSKEAAGTYGIMKLSDSNQIVEFAEKPKVIPEGYADEDNNCLTNTFQFAVSNEAFDVLNLIEPYFSTALTGKERRDWSKHLVPTIMAISQYDSPQEMRKNLRQLSGQAKNDKYIPFLDSVPDQILLKAKNMLKGQKVVAVPTNESWADVGQLSSLYDVTIDIAKGNFKLLDFERANVLKCINPRTGLVTMSPEQKAEIEDKYDVSGEVIVVPKAQKVDSNTLKEFSDYITVNEPK